MEHEAFLTTLREVVTLPDPQAEKLWEFFGVFAGTAEKLNLTGLKDPADRAKKLFIDSLTPLKFCDFSKIKSALDLGTGGGFPGIPLAIALPNVKFTLVDSTRKKVDAVNQMIEKLQLKNATALWKRSEQLVKEKKTFEVVFAKAVANLLPLLHFALPLVQKNGTLVAFLGPHEDAHNIEAGQVLRKYREKIVQDHRYALPGETDERHIAVFTRPR